MIRFGPSELSTCLKDFEQYTVSLYERLRSGGAETEEELALVRYTETDSFVYYAMMLFFQYRNGQVTQKVRRIP